MRLLAQIRNNKAKKYSYKNDVVAGIIVALVSIPISMGYAQIAGLPVVYGLFGSLLPILVFGFLTTSPQFVVGIDAMPAVMVGALLSTMEITAESKEALAVVPIVSLVVCGWFLLFYFVKAGRIVKYISTPVMGGFISGVGFTIILMQIPKLFGGTAGTGTLIVLILHIIKETKRFHVLSFVLGLGTVLIIMVCKKLIPKVPMTVIMLFIGAILQGVFHLDAYGVKLLPTVASGFPKLCVPQFSYVEGHWQELFLESFSIALVIMAQTLLASGNYAKKYNDTLNVNGELLAYAAMNFCSAAIGCPPINGSVSRSGIADSFHCRSQVMSISAAVTMLLVLLFGTPFLKYLPVPILTGIVMTALIGILEIKLSKRLWDTSKNEWTIFMISFLGVLFAGTVNGVIVGCVLSFMEVAIRAVNPPRAFVGRIPGHGNFYALDRNKNACEIKQVVIYRFGGNLFFANIDRFETELLGAIKEDTKCVVVDARGIGTVDITAVDRLLMLADNLKQRNIKFYMTEHEGSLNDEIRLLGGERLLEEGYMRRTITLALRDAGFEKPYILENNSETVILAEEPDEQLAEFEWAFGEQAEEKLRSMAEKVADEMLCEPSAELAVEKVFEQKHVETFWGILGRFDENEFWDYLEMQLEKRADLGKMSAKQLTDLEEFIEAKRVFSETRLGEMNPHAIEVLREHRKKLRARLKSQNPRGYAHLENLRKNHFEHLKQTNPELAKTLQRLHDEVDETEKDDIK